jgi:acetyltransferase-like isoleucine patch superfamily enzyme
MKQGKNCTIYHPEKSVILDCTIGDDCTIHAPVWIGNNVIIGDRCKIQAFAFIPDGVTLGDDVFIGPSVTFTNDKYPPSMVLDQTFVGGSASIGAGSTIICGLEIGFGSTVGAGSVVTKNVPAHTLVMGNPAK